jgi:hypothetical protein
MFVKHGDGKIVDVLEEEELTEEQKKSAKNFNKQVVKQSEQTDSLKNKNSGR